MDQVKIGKFISELRKEKKLTQAQLAEKLGVSQKSVSRWETGKNMPDISLLQLLSSELGITVSELLDGERSVTIRKDTEEAINQIINYSITTKREQIFSKQDVDFISGVIAALVVIILIISGFRGMQTIPLVILGLMGIGITFRLIFGKCSSCGKLLPFSPRKMRSCPFCGAKIKVNAGRSNLWD